MGGCGFTQSLRGDMHLGLLFPGQGSQYVGMGKDLSERYPDVADLFDLADQTLGFSLTSVMFHGPEGKLMETAYSQPAIYVHGIAVWRVLSTCGLVEPVVASGLSLGEYTALVATGRSTFEDVLRVVHKRAELMQAACQKNLGAMLAVLGLNSDIVERAIRDLGEGIWTANYNAPKQIVVAGVKEKVMEAGQILSTLGAKRVIPLKVSGAFHTPMMLEAQNCLAPYLCDLTIAESDVVFASNVDSQLLVEPETIRENLMRQMVSPTFWYQTCYRMAPMVDQFIELGPGKVIAGLASTMALGKPVTSLGTVETIENFLSGLGI